MNRLSGYHIGLFVNEMDAAMEHEDWSAIIRAAKKFLPKARVLEQQIFDHLKEVGQDGKTAA